MQTKQTTKQSVAEQCAQKMLSLDEASKSLDVKICQISPGQASLAMQITDKMLNGHKTCHGGFIFTLADSAFAIACNSYNKTAVAASCDISFVRPGFAGDTLTATATEQYNAGRNGIYDVAVTNQNDETIALFRGKSRVISKTGSLDDTETS